MAESFIDITEDICPMTAVKARLAIERITSGDMLIIRLSSGEPIKNVPEMLKELGHKVINIKKEYISSYGETYLLEVIKR